MVNSIKILEELKEILSSEVTKDENHVSLYILKELMHQKRNEYSKITDNYEKTFKKIIKANYDLNAELIIHEFDYKRNHLVLSFKAREGNDHQRLIYTMKDGSLIPLNKKAHSSYEVLYLLEDKLMQLYNDFMKFNDFMTQNSYFKKIINTNFEFSVIDPYLTINYRNSDTDMLDDFDLSYNDKKNLYECDTKYDDVSKLIQLNEDKIFKNSFVNIKDCPKWSRNILYNTRKEELKNNKQKILN